MRNELKKKSGQGQGQQTSMTSGTQTPTNFMSHTPLNSHSPMKLFTTPSGGDFADMDFENITSLATGYYHNHGESESYSFVGAHEDDKSLLHDIFSTGNETEEDALGACNVARRALCTNVNWARISNSRSLEI